MREVNCLVYAIYYASEEKKTDFNIDYTSIIKEKWKNGTMQEMNLINELRMYSIADLRNYVKKLLNKLHWFIAYYLFYILVLQATGPCVMNLDCRPIGRLPESWMGMVSYIKPDSKNITIFFSTAQCNTKLCETNNV